MLLVYDGDVHENRPFLCVHFECSFFTPGEGTPYDGQCTMLGGLDPHFRAWLDPLSSPFSI